MTTRTSRKIVKIDEDKCNGCGACVPACAEGALQIIDGKAKLVSEIYCDGLGACLGGCPLDAIIIEEREAEDFDEEAVVLHLEEETHAGEELACGCPSSTVTQFERQETTGTAAGAVAPQPSMLTQWPIQLTLVPPVAPFLQGTDLMLAADCVPFAYTGFHQEFLKDHSLLVACPKLDDYQAHLKKLSAILSLAQPKSLTVLHMEVPCCFSLVNMAQEAVLASGIDIPCKAITIGVRGEIQSES
jgi:Fe-S-cluster-containing hydrogenase component 2